MTSGHFTTLPLTAVWVDRDKRQRRELADIEGLMDSIRRTGGLINPITIRASGELVAGERRLTAVTRLGWTHVPVQFLEDLSEHEVRVIELEENIRRVDLEWKDECKAVADYHALRAQDDPAWTMQATADALGMTVGAISQKLSVAQEITNGNERVIAAPAFSTARGIVERETSRRRSSAIKSITSAATSTDEPEPVVEAPILCADFREWQKSYDGPKFNLIHCDFPYGVNADKHHMGASAGFGGYEDTIDTYARLLDSLEAAMENVVAESAHLIFWFSMQHYWSTCNKLMKMGWRVDPFPLIWHRNDNSGIMPDPQRGPRRGYETAFFASRGDRKVVQPVSNIIGSANTKEHHMSEKPLPVLSHFFRMVCDEYSTLLDPTCGSGNALIAARGAKANTVLGLEIDPEFAARAKENWHGNE
jgi:ParB/RepB/Spo0J family partition protein